MLKINAIDNADGPCRHENCRKSPALWQSAIGVLGSPWLNAASIS
jgi:hypothetical protein